MEIKFDKKSKEWLLMMEYWNFWQKYGGIEADNDDYWSAMIDEGSAIVKKYSKTPYEKLARGIFIELMEHFDRLRKTEVNK